MSTWLAGCSYGSESGGEANDAACDACASVAGLERFIVTSLAEVVGLCVADDGSSDDGVLSRELNMCVFKCELAYTVLASFNIAEVADVTDFTDWSSVRLAVWVEVGSGRLAALNQIAYEKERLMSELLD